MGISFNEDEGAVYVQVDDDGRGLPEDQLETVFLPFVKLDEDQPGSGLGLAISRTIVKDHGGSVTLTNRLSGGLRAELRLPRLYAAQ